MSNEGQPVNTPRLRWKKWLTNSHKANVRRAIMYSEEVCYLVTHLLYTKELIVRFVCRNVGTAPTLDSAQALAQARFDALCEAIEKMKEKA